MSRISREQFVDSLSREGAATQGISLDQDLAGRLARLGIEPGALREVGGRDGVVSTTEELGRLFDLIDTLDHNGSRGSIATTTQDASGHEELTASGTAFAALKRDLADARWAAHLRGPVPQSPAPLAARQTLNRDEVFKDLARFEGSKSYMYQDSRGYVTTGVGHLLKTVADAERLPWINSATGKPATGTEIDAAFASVKAMPTGRKAHAYRREGGLVLPAAKARELATTRLEKEFLPGLRKLYPQFDTFPPGAQRALIDMAYNCGLGGLARFHHLAAAVEKQDWAAAAGACHRKSSREERNEWTQKMFLAAVDEKLARRSVP